MSSYEYLNRMFAFCKRIDCPMAINVHYWYLRDNPEVREDLIRFVKYALDKGAVPSTLSQILK